MLGGCLSGSSLKQRLAAILAADVVEYSRLMAANEQATVEALDLARTLFQQIIESHQGRVVDMAGDSVLAVFETASGAVTAGLAIQERLADQSQVPEDRRMRYRVGIHLGDVIEHMTKINEQMPAILKLIKPGGLLIAQGPLEGNANVFTLGIRLSRSFRSAPIHMAPYHVMLATRKGQEDCFQRFQLRQEEFSVTEVSWPAPSRLSSADLVRPRALGLYGLRRVSQAVSAVKPRWGNRYFYVGQTS